MATEYRTRPAAPTLRPTQDAAENLLPVTQRCRPHDRQPCLLTASASQLVVWNVAKRDFYPDLRQLPLRVGANGVRRYSDNKPDPTPYANDLTRMGFRVLVNGDPALAGVVPDGLFLVEYACQRGFIATVPFWERPGVAVPTQEMSWVVDEDAYLDFVQRLLDAQIIAAPSEAGKRACMAATQMQLHSAEQTRDALARQGRSAAARDLQISNLQVRLAHMQLRLDGLDPFEYEGEVVKSPGASLRRVGTVEPGRGGRRKR